MGAEQDDGAREAAILHLRHGDEHLAGERGQVSVSLSSNDISPVSWACKPRLAALRRAAYNYLRAPIGAEAYINGRVGDLSWAIGRRIGGPQHGLPRWPSCCFGPRRR